MDQPVAAIIAVIANVPNHKETHTARVSEQHPIGVRLTEVVGASLAGASPVLDIDDGISTMGESRGETGRVRTGTLSSMANGFLCHVITTVRARRADVQILRRPPLSKRGRLNVVDVLRVAVVPAMDVEQLWAERVVVAVPIGIHCMQGTRSRGRCFEVKD
jgi:hypothetical protein